MVDVKSMPKTKKKLPYWPEKLIGEIKIHGGKNYLCRRIFSLAPTHYDWYIDAYGGAGSMTYNAPAVKQQWFNDKNYFRWMVKNVIKQWPGELEGKLRALKYDEETFLAHKKMHEINEAAHKANCLSGLPYAQIESAVSYIVTCRMSRGGLGESFAWSDRLRGGQPGDLNAWCTMLDRLLALSRRLQPVHLIHGLATNLILQQALRAKQDGKRLFVYLDPPYLKSTRSTQAVEYGDDEMTIEDHDRMLDLVNRCDNVHFAISTYNNTLYENKLKDWRREEFSMPNHSGQGDTKERRFEILYLNF